jgi:hypothetical protein
VTRRQLLLALLAACASPQRPGPLPRAAGWLAAQQGEDGGFHSVTIGFLRGGASLTGLALHALSRAAAQAPLPPEVSQRAVRFLLGQRGQDGGLGWGLVPDYPTYATALALQVLAELRPPGWQEEGAPLARWLLGQQLQGEAWGEHPCRGGFPMGSPEPRTPPHAGHVDLSITRVAVCALRAWGLQDDHPAWAEARRFVLRCRGPEGGFLYAPGEPGLNKGHDPEASYGTATADGILALRATGGEPALLEQSTAWLASRFRADQNPDVGGSFAAFGPAMRFYWRAVAAEVFAGAASGAPPGWADALRSSLQAEQRPDGSFVNERAEQKENDPLVATSLAVLALGAVRG